MRKAIAAKITQTREGPISVTASFGVAMVSPGLRDFDKALAIADEAMYAAKSGGRNMVREAAPAGPEFKVA